MVLSPSSSPLQPKNATLVRMQTLNTLRWLAVGGQAAALVVTTLFLDIVVPLDLCILAVVLAAAFTLGMSLVYPPAKRLNEHEAVLTLLFDLAQLSVMIFLTGGLSNPFCVLILAQTTIGATLLSIRATVFLCAVTSVMIVTIAVWSIPLHTSSGEILIMPEIFVWGMMTSLLIALIFLAVYARRVTGETFGMAEALAATQLALERELKLTTLGGVVAAAAHELGTPLATIKLVSTELESELGDREDLREDVALIRSQADRLRDILRGMGKIGNDDELTRQAPFQAVVEEAAEPHMSRGIPVFIRSEGPPQERQPAVPRHPEIIHGLRNLVQNAVDFAKSAVWIDLNWDDVTIRATVGDDGLGFPPDLIGRIGDPFVRHRFSRLWAESQRPGYEGMGLGLFIAKTLLERTGAQLTFANGSVGSRSRDMDDAVPISLRSPSGAIVELVWQRVDLQSGMAHVAGPLGPNRPVS